MKQVNQSKTEGGGGGGRGGGGGVASKLRYEGIRYCKLRSCYLISFAELTDCE